jgi:hypothetical protein
MKRMLVGALLGALSLSAVSSTLPGLGSVAHAAPKEKKKAKAKASAAVPQSAEIAKIMGELKWGTTRDEVFEHFSQSIKDKYKPKLAKAGGALEEDKLRAKMKDELAKLKSSIVDFNGKKTGWDVSFLKGEFTHHNSESLFVVSDDTSENYYFFIQNKLWKWYKAFKAEAFAGKSFDQFAAAIQDKFGPSQKREGDATHGGGKQSWLEWQDPTTRLRAVDNGQFYGFYCLVFEDKDTLRKLPQLRTTKVAEKTKGNSLVDSVTSDEANNAASDSNPDVMDRITGKMRHRQEAPEGTGSKKGESGKPTESAPLPPPPSGGGVSKEDDPLKGLGL